MTKITALEILKGVLAPLGYRFEVSPDGQEERMYRPDGTLALVARRTPQFSIPKKLIDGCIYVPFGEFAAEEQRKILEQHVNAINPESDEK